MTARQGWFADVDPDEQPSPRYPWQPVLQIDGMCMSIDVWHANQKACEAFIRDRIIGQGMIDDSEGSR